MRDPFVRAVLVAAVLWHLLLLWTYRDAVDVALWRSLCGRDVVAYIPARGGWTCVRGIEFR